MCARGDEAGNGATADLALLTVGTKSGHVSGKHGTTFDEPTDDVRCAISDYCPQCPIISINNPVSGMLRHEGVNLFSEFTVLRSFPSRFPGNFVEGNLRHIQLRGKVVTESGLEAIYLGEFWDGPVLQHSPCPSLRALNAAET